MELRLAILGGVIPATILGVVLVVAGLLGSRRPPARTIGGSGPEGASPDVPRALRPVGFAWILGAALALPLIHYTTWSWPVLWPKDATYRLLHAAGILLGWSLVEFVVPGRPWVLRPACRALAVFGAMFILLEPYEGVLGWAKVVGGGAAGAVLAVLCAELTRRAQVRHHPAAAMACLFLSAAGGVGVLFLGKTATAAQASAGLAALAAATGVASILTRRSTPTMAGAFVLSGLLAWLLAVGCFGTGQTNLASSVLLLLSPLGMALPIPKIDLFWKKLAPGLVIGAAWALVCVGAAVAIAVLTQPAAPPDYGY